MDLVPAESASNTGGSAIDATRKSSGDCSFYSSIVTDLVTAYGSMDSVSYQQLFDLVRSFQRVQERALSLDCAAMRVGSSVSSSSSERRTSQATGAVGGKNARLESIKRAASWRKKQIPDGLCYARMLRSEHAESAMNRLRDWPTVASVLQLSATSFRPVDELEKLTMHGDPTAVHVGEPVVGGVPLLPAFAKVAKGMRNRPGSFGAVLNAYDVSVAGGVPGVVARTAVGGSRVEPSSGSRFSSDVLRVGDAYGSRPIVFLAGTNEKTAGDGWRDEFLRDSAAVCGGCDVAVPRNSDLSHLSVSLEARAGWERNMMLRSEGIVFNFLKGTSSSVSLLELGYFSTVARVAVVCEEGFDRKDSVLDFCRFRGVKVCSSVFEAFLYASNRSVQRTSGRVPVVREPGSEFVALAELHDLSAKLDDVLGAARSCDGVDVDDVARGYREWFAGVYSDCSLAVAKDPRDGGGSSLSVRDAELDLKLHKFALRRSARGFCDEYGMWF